MYVNLNQKAVLDSGMSYTISEPGYSKEFHINQLVRDILEQGGLKGGREQALNSLLGLMELNLKGVVDAIPGGSTRGIRVVLPELWERHEYQTALLPMMLKLLQNNSAKKLHLMILNLFNGDPRAISGLKSMLSSRRKTIRETAIRGLQIFNTTETRRILTEHLYREGDFVLKMVVQTFLKK